MIATRLEQMVQGPLNHPEFESTVLVDPVVDAGRPGRFPSQAVIITTAARKIIELSKAGEKLKSVVVASQNERDPMSHPEFRAISENLRELVDKWFPKARLTLVSPGLALDDPETRHALVVYHRPILHFEAGTQKTFAALTGQEPKRYKDVVENLRKLELDRWILRARFVSGAADNSTDSELRGWLGHLENFNPGQIQITTPAKPITEKKLKPVSKTRIATIAEKTAAKTGKDVEILEGAGA
ncbi:MAG: hypothetical protein R3F34_05855 [Planctomycetota bacterium]